MSEQQNPEVYGSGLARMFGYVTPEDRSRWMSARVQNEKKVGTVRTAMKAALGSMSEFSERNMQAKLSAAHRVAAQQQFEESHEKVVTQHRKPRTRSITETVDYESKDDRQEIEPDFEL